MEAPGGLIKKRAKERVFLFYYIAVLMATTVLFAIFYFGAGVLTDEDQAAQPDKQNLLSNGDLMVYDDTGALLYRVHAKQATYSLNEEYFGFTESQMTYHTGTGKLLVDSGRGRIFDQGTTVLFDNEVRLKRLSSNEHIIEDLRTRNLTLDVEQRLAHGQEAAEINYGKHQITGTGVRIDLDTGKIKLLRDVKTKS